MFIFSRNRFKMQPECEKMLAVLLFIEVNVVPLKVEKFYSKTILGVVRGEMRFYHFLQRGQNN